MKKILFVVLVLVVPCFVEASIEELNYRYQNDYYLCSSNMLTSTIDIYYLDKDLYYVNPVSGIYLPGYSQINLLDNYEQIQNILAYADILKDKLSLKEAKMYLTRFLWESLYDDNYYFCDKERNIIDRYDEEYQNIKELINDIDNGPFEKEEFIVEKDQELSFASDILKYFMVVSSDNLTYDLKDNLLKIISTGERGYIEFIRKNINESEMMVFEDRDSIIATSGVFPNRLYKYYFTAKNNEVELLDEEEVIPNDSEVKKEITEVEVKSVEPEIILEESNDGQDEKVPETSDNIIKNVIICIICIFLTIFLKKLIK